MLSAPYGHSGSTMTWINEASGTEGRKCLKLSQHKTEQTGIKVIREMYLYNVVIAEKYVFYSKETSGFF